jgi:hypothetical protein
LTEPTATPEPDESTLTKIQKMLRLAGSTNAAESEAAMGKVMEFLTRYNLTLQQVEAHNAPAKKYINHKYEGSSFAPEHTHVGRIVHKFFEVRIVEDYRGSINFLGTESNVEIAIYIYGYLSQMFDLLWQLFEIRNPKLVDGNPAARSKYQTGLSDGLLNELTRQRRRAETEMGLTLVTDTELTEYYYQQYPQYRPLTNEQWLAKYGPLEAYKPPPPEPKAKRVKLTPEELAERARQRGKTQSVTRKSRQHTQPAKRGVRKYGYLRELRPAMGPPDKLTKKVSS